jgi:hypothetical protein
MQYNTRGGVPVTKPMTVPLKKQLQSLHLNKKYKSIVPNRPVLAKPTLYKPNQLDDLIDNFSSLMLPKTKKSKKTKKSTNVLTTVVKKQKAKTVKPTTKTQKMSIEPSRASTRNKKQPNRLLF